MEEMSMSSIENLEAFLDEVPKIINRINGKDFINKISSTKWSKQEMLGHLCDSAINNHSRFARIILTDEPIALDGYQQNEWVKIHDYQLNYDRSELIDLWKQLNKLILNVMRNAHESDLKKLCILNDNSKVTLNWLFDDYLNHMMYHMKQIEG
jgi:hypothetical protein